MIKLFSYGVLIAILLSCNKGKNIAETPFDRKAMLQEVATQLIKPAFNSLQIKADSLALVANTFAQTPNNTTLSQLQQKWLTTYLAYQSICVYNFGEAGEDGLRKSLAEEIATFPTSSTKIETAISNNAANFNDFNRDARGFLAIEYLIFDLANNQAKIIADFQSQNRKDYLLGAINNLKNRVTTVATSWNGSYIDSFSANDGTAAGSSTSMLYNEFVKSFEGLKNFKVALPLGKRAGQTQTEPARVEAYYSGKSLTMLKKHLTTLEIIWRKFTPYLQSVEGGNALLVATENQLTNMKNVLQGIAETPSFSAQIQNNPIALEPVFIELQKLTRYFKGDMSSVLGIAITYSSGDGD